MGGKVWSTLRRDMPVAFGGMQTHPITSQSHTHQSLKSALVPGYAWDCTLPGKIGGQDVFGYPELPLWVDHTAGVKRDARLP